MFNLTENLNTQSDKHLVDKLQHGMTLYVNVLIVEEAYEETPWRTVDTKIYPTVVTEYDTNCINWFIDYMNIYLGDHLDDYFERVGK